MLRQRGCLRQPKKVTQLQAFSLMVPDSGSLSDIKARQATRAIFAEFSVWMLCLLKFFPHIAFHFRNNYLFCLATMHLAFADFCNVNLSYYDPVVCLSCLFRFW